MKAVPGINKKNKKQFFKIIIVLSLKKNGGLILSPPFF